jgi:hypothetical protein
MELTKKEYTFTRETTQKVMDALQDNWFYGDEDDEYNNEPVIEASEALEAEILAQQ